VVLVDGFPRSLEQAEEAERQLGPPAAVLFFDCSEATMRERVLGRGKSSGRMDDNEETFAKRCRTYREQTLPVRDYYENRSILRVVSAEPPPDEVFAAVCRLVDMLQAAEDSDMSKAAAASAAEHPDPTAAPSGAGYSGSPNEPTPSLGVTAGAAMPLPEVVTASAAVAAPSGISAGTSDSAPQGDAAAAASAAGGEAAAAQPVEKDLGAAAATGATAAQDSKSEKAVRKSLSTSQARRTGPRSSRSISPSKRRTTGKAPAKQAVDPAADEPSAAVVAAAAEEAADAAEAAAAALAASSDDDGRTALAEQQQAAAEAAMFAPAPGDDDMIADAKRMAAEAMSGRRTTKPPASGSPRSLAERNRTRTRSGSVAVAASSASVKPSRTASTKAKPFSWLYEDEAPELADGVKGT
jgi:hypothetical protein